MRIKYTIKSKAATTKWIEVANLLAKSLCPKVVVLQQFNNLTPLQRIEIRKKFLVCDEVRKKKIPNGEADEAWLIGIMVDAHIIAYEYNIDPLTVALCIYPICKSYERIFVK